MRSAVALAALLALACVASAAPATKPAYKGKPPLVITTDVDIDDLLALVYLIHSDVYDIRAITVNGNAFTSHIDGVPNMLATLQFGGCPNIPVSYGTGQSLLEWGSGQAGIGTVLPKILPPINKYITSCMNQSLSDVPPSPYMGAELIVKALKGAEVPADVLVLGSFTDLALALDREPTIVSKIGTLYISGGQYNITTSPPNTSWPFDTKNKGTGWNVFVDPIAAHMVIKSGIKKIVAMPSNVQNTLPWNMSKSEEVIAANGLKVPPVFWDMASLFAPCTNQSWTEISWWDESAAALMVKEKSGAASFCKQWATIKTSVYTYDGGKFGRTYPDEKYGVPIKVCLKADETEFLTDYWKTVSGQPKCPKPHRSTTPTFLAQGRKLIMDMVAGARRFLAGKPQAM